jgi:hypothetical protein
MHMQNTVFSQRASWNRIFVWNLAVIQLFRIFPSIMKREGPHKDLYPILTYSVMAAICTASYNIKLFIILYFSILLHSCINICIYAPSQAQLLFSEVLYCTLVLMLTFRHVSAHSPFSGTCSCYNCCTILQVLPFFSASASTCVVCRFDMVVYTGALLHSCVFVCYPCESMLLC